MHMYTHTYVNTYRYVYLSVHKYVHMHIRTHYMWVSSHCAVPYGKETPEALLPAELCLSCSQTRQCYIGDRSKWTHSELSHSKRCPHGERFPLARAVLGARQGSREAPVHPEQGHEQCADLARAWGTLLREICGVTFGTTGDWRFTLFIPKLLLTLLICHEIC